jgi:small subunit ribosomal protein S1
MIKLERHDMPKEGMAFVVMPYGTKSAEDGTAVDFDALYEMVYAETITKSGMKPIRADRIWGCDRSILDVIWRGIQSAEVVIVDCSTRSIDVGLELGLSMALGKRLVVTAQRVEDIPTDLRGHLRPVLYTAAGLGVAELVRGLEQELQSVRTETVIENTFVALPTITGEPKPGHVLAVQPDNAVIETEGERELLHLHAANVTYTKRVTDMTHLYKPGDRLSGAITTDIHGKRYYTLLADKQNPWPTIQSDYPVGRVFSGRVTNAVEGKGAWVPVIHDVNGHIPADEARRANLRRYDDVEVEVVYLDLPARRVGLHFRNRVGSTVRPVAVTPAAVTPMPVTPMPAAPGLPEPGQQLRGWVVRTVPEKGFILVELEGREKERPAILPARRMLPDLKEDLRDGKVEINEEVFVQIVRVRRRDNGQWDVELREVPEAQADLAA